MDCPVCRRKWDLKEVRPKALPCQHSLCVSCLGSLNGRQCPQCRKSFSGQMKDNFALVACLEVLDQERPQVPWWCMDCQAASKARCMDLHDVRRPRAALRQGLQDLVPRVNQDLQAFFESLHGPQDGDHALQDSAAMTALLLIRDVPTTCKVALSQSGGVAFAAEWCVDGQGHAEDALLKALAVALAASGSLQQEPMEVHEEEPSAVPVPLEGRIEDIDLGSLSKSLPSALRSEKANMLRRLRQQGVVRISHLHCDYDSTWSLDVLRSAAPTVEELLIQSPLKVHLLLVHSMRRLQRLDLNCNYQSLTSHDESAQNALYALPDVLPPLPQPSSLKALRLRHLPRDTAQSLLTAHCASLDVLWLTACPSEFRGLGFEFLGGLGLRLSKLVLEVQMGHNPFECRVLVAAAHRVLRGCTVQCKDCCRVAAFW